MRTILIIISFVFISLLSYSQSSNLVISQVFFLNNNANSPFGRKYIEIFNRGQQPESIAGFSIQTCNSNGAWQSASLPDTIINAGQYFLIASSAYNTAAPDIVADYYIPDFSLSGNPGEVAICKTTALFIGCNYGTICIDRVLWAAGFTTGCPEGEFAYNPIDENSSLALFRKSNGCQDLNENRYDFIMASANPRNSHTTINICNTGTMALISAGPNINGITKIDGFTSASKYYSLSGYDLNPASGNITVTPSQNFDISVDGINFFSSSLSIPYTGNILPIMNIYVRLSNTTVSGAIITGTITCSGGSAVDAVVQVNGTVIKEYYNTKANLGLENTATWSSTPDGTGPSPLNFTDADLNFNIINQSNANLSGLLNITGSRSKLILGDAVSPISLTIPAATGTYISFATKLIVSKHANLVMQNVIMPFIDYNIGDSSTIELAQAGPEPIIVPRRNYYNLKLTNGYKYFPKDSLDQVSFVTYLNTVISHDLTVDAVQGLNGSMPSSISKVYCAGDITFLNGTSFDPAPTGSDGRFSLSMTGSQTQHINSNGTHIYLLSLSAGNVIFSPGTDFTTDAGHQGGITVSPGGSIQTTGGSITATGGSVFTVLGNLISDGTSFNLLRNDYAVAASEVLHFSPNSTIKDLTVNMPVNWDSVHIASNIDVTGTLTLTKGKLIMLPGDTLKLTATGTMTPAAGSANSFIEGAFNRIAVSPLTFPVGKAYPQKYAPVDITNFNGLQDYTVRYTKQIYPVVAIDPITLASYPGYHTSGIEYWQISPATPGGSADIIFHYTDVNSFISIPSQARIAHFDGTDWNDLGGTPDALNTNANGMVTVTDVSTFSPFTFAGAVAGVVPVKLSSFYAVKQNKKVQLYWTTEQEINTRSFIVERSLNGNKWNEIARLDAAGNSSERRNYSATDFDPADAVNYYRLKQVDIDGKFNYSEIRQVYFSKDNTVALAPNPASDKLTIYFPADSKNVMISIFDENGKLVKKLSSAEQIISISLKGFAKGIYSVIIRGEIINETKKFIVE